MTLQTGGRARLELQPVADEGTSGAFFHVSTNRTTENVENVEVVEISTYEAVNNPVISREEGGTPVNKSDDSGIPMANVGRLPDGTIWCGFMVEHFAQHRDVSSVPWCEICSPVSA